MAKIAVGADYLYWFRKEVVFGTATASDVVAIPTEGFTINHDYKSHQIPRATGKRAQSEDDSWQDTNGSIPDVTMSFFVSPQAANLFPAVLQVNTAYATSSLITLSGNVDYDNLPDFFANEGYFYTIQAEGPAQAYNERLTSAVGNSLKLSVGPDANEGALYAEMGFVAKSSSINAANHSGTLTTPSMAQLFKWSDIDTFTVSALDVKASLYDFEITITNSAKPVPYGGGANMALPLIEGSGSFKLLGNDANALTLKGLAAANTAGNAYSLVLGWGLPVSEAADFGLTANIMITGYTVDKSEEETVTFDYIMVQDGTNIPLTIQYYI